MNSHNITSMTSDSFETFSKLMECQYDTKNEVKDVVVKNVEDESLFFKKVKNTTKSADNYVQKLNNEVLPRCQSAEITSNIVQSDVNIPNKITQFQSSFNEQLGKNIDTDGSNKKSKNMSQREHTHFVDFSTNVRKTNNSQQLSDFSKSHKSVKYCKNNVGTIYIKAQISDEKEKCDSKLHHLTVNQSYRVNVKPELSTKKLDNIRIKPDDKETLRNPKSNVTYREFSFGLEPETRKCQPSSRNLQTGIINDKKVALCEIRNILYGMMNEESSKNPSNDYLISQLQKIMTTLKEIEILEINGSSILKDLVEEHSINGLCETVIKNKLMAITETFNDDNIPTDIENSTNRATKQVPTIKNLVHPINQSMKFPDFFEDNQFVGKVKYACENSSNCHPNNTSHSKNFHNITSKKYISVREFLCQNSSNFASSKTNKINKNSPITKESSFQSTLCFKNYGIQNQNVLNSITTENVLNNENNKSLLKESYYLKYEEDNDSKISARIKYNDFSGANNEISLVEWDQPSKNEENESSIKKQNNIGDPSIDNQIPVHINVQQNIQEKISNSLSLLSDNNEHTDMKILSTDYEVDNLSNSTAFSSV